MRLTYAAMVIIYWSYGKCSVVDVYRFLASLPCTPEMLANPEWWVVTS
jgi:hypothetical protein